MLKKLIILIILIFSCVANQSVFASFESGTIDHEQTFDGEYKDLTHTLNITKGAPVTFTDHSTLKLEKGAIINNLGPNAAPLVFEDGSKLSNDEGTINSVVNLINSSLASKGGHIDTLNVSGDSMILVNKTSFKTLSFTNLGRTDLSASADDDKKKKQPPKGAGFENVNVTNLNVNLRCSGNDNYVAEHCSNLEGNNYYMKNDQSRIVRFKNATIETFTIQGTIDPSTGSKVPDSKDGDTRPLMTTNFNFEGSTIDTLNYTSDNPAEYAYARNYHKDDYGIANFTNTKIRTLNVSFNLLRNLTFAGGSKSEIDHLNLKNTNLSDPNYIDPNPNPDPITTLNTDGSPSTKFQDPTAPAYSNLQFVGAGMVTINNFDLGGLGSYKPTANNPHPPNTLNIEGNVDADKGNASSVNIKNLLNYKDAKFSLYQMQDVVFGDLPAKHDYKKRHKKAADKKKYDIFDYELPDEIDLGDVKKKDTIHISYAYNITRLKFYNQMLKFDMKPNDITHNITLSRVYALGLYNSLLDVTDSQPIPDTSYNDFDLDFERSADDKNANLIALYLYNSGAVAKNKTTGEWEEKDLRIKANVNTNVTAYDMVSNLKMELNSEQNAFNLISDKNKKNYYFHSNYNYCYVKPKDKHTQQPADCITMKTLSGDQQNNMFEFNSDVVIAPLDGALNKKGDKIKGNVWFTYSQPTDDKCANDEKSDTNNGDGTNKDGTKRGGFPCEFKNRLVVKNGTTKFISPLDHLTNLVVLDSGILDLSEMKEEYLKDKEGWITRLTIAGGMLFLGDNPLHIDNLDAYLGSPMHPGMTLRTTLNFSDPNNIYAGKIYVNKQADFHNSYLTFDLFFDQKFTQLKQKLTLDLLELDDYVDADSNHFYADMKNFKGVKFAQGILFDTKYYWKNSKTGEVSKEWKDGFNHLYADITRVYDFSYWIKNSNDIGLANMLDSIIDNPDYQVSVGKDAPHNQKIANAPTLNKSTIELINGLFRAQTVDDLKQYFLALRPINNRFLLNSSLNDTNNILSSINNKNYLGETNPYKLNVWLSTTLTGDAISDDDLNTGGTSNNHIYIIGTDFNLGRVKLGALAGYSNNSFSSAYYGGKSSVVTGGVYSDLSLANNYFININLLSSGTHYKGSRYQYFMNSESAFSIRGINNTAMLKFGKSYEIKDGTFKPYVRGIIGKIKINNYTENPAAAAALTVKGFSTIYYSLGVGVEYYKSFAIDEDKVLTPTIGVGYDFKNYHLGDTYARYLNIDGVNSQNIDVNHELSYSARKIDHNDFTFDSGINLALNQTSNFSFKLTTRLLNKDSTGYAINLGYKYDF